MASNNIVLSLWMVLIFTHEVASFVAPLQTKGGNSDINSAVEFSSPDHKVAAYQYLDQGEIKYYTFTYSGGNNKIGITLYTAPIPEEDGFAPGFVLMGPSGFIPSNYNSNSSVLIPDNVELPAGYDYIVVRNPADKPKPHYWGLIPFSVYELWGLSLEGIAAGKFYVAVYEYSNSGHFALAVGTDDALSFGDYMLGPIMAMQLYIWSGQSAGTVILPLLICFICGMCIITWLWLHNTTPKTWFRWACCISGFLAMGTGFIVFAQMIFALYRAPSQDASDIWITFFFLFVPLICGVAFLFIGFSPRRPNLVVRLSCAGLGLLCLFLWAGYYVCPLVAFIGSFLPSKKIPIPKFCAVLPFVSMQRGSNKSSKYTSTLLVREDKDKGDIELKVVSDDKGKQPDKDDGGLNTISVAKTTSATS